jgi:uncharacterized glyoxalase superfamily protein PhnB
MKLYPSLRYKDAKAAPEWLQEPFGFEPVAFYDQDYGSRDFAVRDLKGNLWNFGTYKPT